MALLEKCILGPAELRDGLRISVMSRHTKEDGKTPDHGIKRNMDHLHLALLGPSPKLIGDYYKRGLPWADFETRYLAEMAEPAPQRYIYGLYLVSRVLNITLLCIEQTSTHCHRRLLKSLISTK